ncbi:hypothetical protein OFO94_37520, partial [Escherichia coli]|nr:hypothetical protein [Escherichia coli]
AQILTFDGVDFCRSLFDEDIFQVTNFTVNSKVVPNGTNISAGTDGTLALQTVDGVINQVAEFSIKQRNWQ